MGANLLALTHDDAALSEFSRAQELARDTGDVQNELLNAGFYALIGALSGHGEAQTAFTSIIERFRGMPEDATFFADQLDKALVVFRTSRARSTS